MRKRGGDITAKKNIYEFNEYYMPQILEIVRCQKDTHTHTCI